MCEKGGDDYIVLKKQHGGIPRSARERWQGWKKLLWGSEKNKRFAKKSNKKMQKEKQQNANILRCFVTIKCI